MHPAYIVEVTTGYNDFLSTYVRVHMQQSEYYHLSPTALYAGSRWFTVRIVWYILVYTIPAGKTEHSAAATILHIRDTIVCMYYVQCVSLDISSFEI